jgi:hypothetical protein
LPSQTGDRMLLVRFCTGDQHPCTWGHVGRGWSPRYMVHILSTSDANGGVPSLLIGERQIRKGNSRGDPKSGQRRRQVWSTSLITPSPHRRRPGQTPGKHPTSVLIASSIHPRDRNKMIRSCRHPTAHCTVGSALHRFSAQNNSKYDILANKTLRLNHF